MNGPLFNKAITHRTDRDNLGIDGVYASISSDLCPIVNTVTPTPFYWVFLDWIYYDAHENAGIALDDKDSFNKFLRRQDFYFILASVLLAQSEYADISGSSSTLVGNRNDE